MRTTPVRVHTLPRLHICIPTELKTVVLLLSQLALLGLKHAHNSPRKCTSEAGMCNLNYVERMRHFHSTPAMPDRCPT
jgi:hypothetical protein